MKRGRIVVISGLPASGKTTITRHLGADGMATILPEAKDWAASRFPVGSSPSNLAEKKAKQLCISSIDLERCQKSKLIAQQGRDVICDSDFLTTLAYNYAESKESPHLDAFEWLLDLYCRMLECNLVTIADAYIFLDVNIQVRRQRRLADVERKRNDIFFRPLFAENMRIYYLCAMNRLMRSGITSVWNLKYDGDFEHGAREITQIIKSITVANDLPVTPTRGLIADSFYRTLSLDDPTLPA